MYSLFLDCTTKRLVVAILRENEYLDSYYFNTNKNLIDVINNIINEILSKNKLKHNSIKNIYCINGPGNFTGIRVGKIISDLWKEIFDITLYQLNKLDFIYDNNKLSLIEADKLNYYINDNNQIRIIKKELINIENYNFNANNYDFKMQWELNGKKFKKTENISSLYIKNAI